MEEVTAGMLLPWSFAPVLPVPLLAALAACAAAFVALAYRAQRGLLSRERLVALAALRAAALVALVLLLLRPQERVPVPAAGDKQILEVAVDASASMRTCDAGATNRFGAVTAALARHRATLARLAEAYDLRFHLFGERLQPVALADLLGAVAPDGAKSDLAEPLAHAAESARQRKVAGLYLMTDGRENVGGDPMSAALALKGLGVPVYASCVGTAQDASDVYCRARLGQNFVFAGQPARLDVAVAQSGYDRYHANVHLYREDRPVEIRTTVLNQGVIHLDFPVREERRGLYRYRVRVDPLPGEGDTRNNERVIFVRVVDRKTRVLFVEGRPYWDSKFVLRTLQRDPNIETDSIFHLTGDKVFALAERTSRDSLQKETARRDLLRFPHGREELFAYDCVILGRGLDDVLSPADADLLRDFAADRGGSLIFLRGRAGERLAALDDLAPVVWDDALLRDVKLELTAEGRLNPIFAFHQPQPADVIVRALPAMLSVTRVRAEKSLAVVLATAGAGAPTGRVAAIAYQRVGRGKVMSLGTAGLWHWAFLPDAQGENADVYQQLWAQIVRWMVSDSDFLPGQDISFRTDRYVYQPGERIRFLVRSKLAGASFQPVVEVHPPAGPPVSLKAARSADAEDHLAWFNPEAEGEYRATLRDATGRPAAEDVRFTVYADFDEARLVAADPGLLANLARTTGGAMLGLDELPRLPGLLQASALAARRREEPRDAWDNGWVYSALVSLFALEWYHRRKWGLV